MSEPVAQSECLLAVFLLDQLIPLLPVDPDADVLVRLALTSFLCGEGRFSRVDVGLRSLMKRGLDASEGVRVCVALALVWLNGLSSFDRPWLLPSPGDGLLGDGAAVSSCPLPFTSLSSAPAKWIHRFFRCLQDSQAFASRRRLGASPEY